MGVRPFCYILPTAVRRAAVCDVAKENGVTRCGTADKGGGIAILSSDPVIRRCVIRDNNADEGQPPNWLRCPSCGAVMRIVETFERAPYRGRDPP